MRALLVALSAVAATLHGNATAHAVGTAIVVADDPRGDVHISHDSGLTSRDRKSIDLRRFTVTDTGDSIRFSFDVRRVDRSRRLNQLWFVNLTTGEPLYTQLQVITHQLAVPPIPHGGFVHAITVEGADTPHGFVHCELHVSYRQGSKRWWIEAPKDCLPAGPVQLEVYAQTTPGPDRNSSAQTSRDVLPVPGSYDLGGTVHAAA